MYQMFSSHDMLMWYQTKHTGAWTNMNDHSDIAMGLHDYVMTWIHLPHYWPLVRGFLSQRASNGQYADYRSIPLIKSQWWGVLVFSWTVCWTNIWLPVILKHIDARASWWKWLVVDYKFSEARPLNYVLYQKSQVSVGKNISRVKIWRNWHY